MGTEENRWRVPSLFWLPLIICGTVLLLITDVFQLQYYSISPTRLQADDLLQDQKSLKGFLVKTPGCRIPHMKPFDESVRKFIKKEKRPKCNKGIPALIDSNLTSIFLVESALPIYTPENNTSLKCCYRCFYRKEPKENVDDNKIKFDTKCFEFAESAEISDEFIKVTCNVGNRTIYKDFFSFVPIKPAIKKTMSQQKPLNVLIIGLDAVSRLNFHRQMPKTSEHFKKISAIEFLGYNKVGDNTFPNLIPVLTGLSEKELKNVCWKDAEKRFDDCPFIWKDFKDKNFVTAFGEDSAWMGIFNYMKKGFKKQPTDYMWGPFNRASESEIGNSHNMNVQECVGAREVYKVFLDYIKNFVTKMNTAEFPYFAFFWGASLSHDYLNKPRLGDEDYYEFFKDLQGNDHLNNTALIMMSDHGIRWGDIRQTYQGRMEERLPFIFIILPKWYKRQYPDAYANLLKNTRRLTTPFDLHETLKDLINPFILSREFLQKRIQNKKVRGYSLFNEITQKRTCEDADIASHWCTCQQSFEISKNDSMVVQSSNFAVDYMNSLLTGYNQCSKLKLNNILNARLMTHGDHILNGEEVRDYMITLETLPGEGVFEVTVRNLRGTNKTYHEVMGTISRLNLYGKQSACITDFHLKLYCYCKSLL